MMSRAFVSVALIMLLPQTGSTAAQEPTVFVESTVTVRVTAEKDNERVTVRGALYSGNGMLQIVDHRTPIEWTARTTMLNGILQAEDGKRIRVDVTEAGKKGGSSGFGTNVIVAYGLPSRSFLMFPSAKTN